MTVRARRLAKYLEERGWSVYDTLVHCTKCRAAGSGKYCGECGAKMPPPDRKTTVAELEAAIKYALKEDVFMEKA